MDVSFTSYDGLRPACCSTGVVVAGVSGCAEKSFLALPGSQAPGLLVRFALLGDLAECLGEAGGGRGGGPCHLHSIPFQLETNLGQGT